MTTLADRSIEALRTNYDDLAARVRAFDDAQLTVTSGAREWTVAQVLSHLGSGSEIMRAGLEAAVAGDPPPEQDFNMSVWARWDAMSPREQADGYLESAGKLMTAMESLDDTGRQQLRVPLGFLPEPADLALFSGLRLTEAALHSWDVRIAFDPRAALSDEEADLLVSQLSGPLSWILGFSAKPETLDVPAAALQVTTTDSSRSLLLTLAPTTVLSETSGDSAGVLSGPAESLVRLLAGRYETVRTSESLTLESDTLTVEQLQQVFPGY